MGSGDSLSSPDPTAEQAKIYYRKVAAVILVLAIAIGLGITFGNSDDSSNSSESIRKPSKAAALADKLAAGNVDQIRLDFDEKSLDAAETWARHQVPICKERNQRLRSEGVITESQFQDARKTCTFDFQEDLALRSMRPDWIDVCFELESAKIKGSDIASVSQSLWRRRITEERPKTKEFLESTPSWDGNSSSIQNQFIEEFTKSQVKDDLLTATDYLCPQHSRHINSLE